MRREGSTAIQGLEWYHGRGGIVVQWQRDEEGGVEGYNGRGMRR